MSVSDEDRLILCPKLHYDIIEQAKIRWIIDVHKYGEFEVPPNYDNYYGEHIVTTNYFPFSIQPPNGATAWNATWQKTTRLHLEEAAKFIRTCTMTYPNQRHLNALIYGPEAECVAVLFAFLVVRYHGNYEYIKEHMLSRDMEWTLDKYFPLLFKYCIIYPMLATYNSECEIN